MRMESGWGLCVESEDYKEDGFLTEHILLWGCCAKLVCSSHPDINIKLATIVNPFYRGT